MAGADELAGIPLFESLSESDRQKLASSFDERTATQETSGETTLGDLEPGDFFGEVAILGKSRHSATVTTTTPVKLLVMFGSDFRRLQETQPGIAARVEEAMQQRLSSS